MFENIYTTKMSDDKKKLQSRFFKIGTKNTKFSKFTAIIILIAVLIIMAVVAVGVAVKLYGKENEYEMSETDFEEFVKNPIGSVMADMDYVDEKKLVFHYGKGFFVVNLESNEISQKIDLSKLNISHNQQGSNVIDVKIDSNGNFAYLSSIGAKDEIKDFGEYVVNLENGKVKEGSIPKNAKIFDKIGQTSEKVENPEGWFSNNCVTQNEKVCYLTTHTGNVSDILLVTVHNDVDKTIGYKYVFPDYYVSPSQKIDDVIKASLKENEEIAVNSGISEKVSGSVTIKAFSVLAKSRNIKLPSSLSVEKTFDMIIYDILNNDKNYILDTERKSRLFIIDSEKTELVFNCDLTSEEFNDIVKIISEPERIEPEYELYGKTAEFLEKEFHRVYDKYYDIQSLRIKNWQENGNEATFFYNMKYLYYNRDPDKADYILEIKKQGDKEKYKKYYDDYLALKESNYEFKVVLKGEEFELYSNVSPNGTEWELIKLDDFVK